MNNTSVMELNIEDLGIVSGGELRKSRMYSIASCIANVKCGRQTMEVLNSTFPSEEEQAYIRLIWDEVPPDPYTTFDSPNIPTMNDIYNELMGM